MELFGLIAAVLAIAGVMLNNRRLRSCFWLWMVSNLICLGLHVQADLWSLAVRDAVFFVLAIEGLIRWSKKPKSMQTKR